MNALPIIAAITVVVVIFVNVLVILTRYVKVGPNQMLIVSGRQHRLPDGRVLVFRVVKGGGTFVLPIFERADVLSLEVLTVELPLTKARVGDATGVEVDCLAQVKINSDDAAIAPAMEYFLGKSPAEIKGIVRPILETHVAETLAGSSVESIMQNPAACANAMQAAASGDFSKMGMSLLSISLRDVRTA